MRKLQTELNNRILRFDGVSILEPDEIMGALASGVKPSELRVSELNDDIQQFNEQVSDFEQIALETIESISIKFDWLIPKQYQDLDLWEYVVGVFEKRSKELQIDQLSPQKQNECVERLATELEEIKRRGMVEFTKTVIYILDTFKEKNIVWGVGRGSSCASYVLFILGLHSVDCVKFEVPMEEFFHD